MITYSKQTPQKFVTMKNHNKENTAYLNFIQDLKDILTDFDISLLSKSWCLSVYHKKGDADISIPFFIYNILTTIPSKTLESYFLKYVLIF